MKDLDELTKAVVEHQKKTALELIDYVYENGIKVVTVIAGNKTAVFRVMDLSNVGMDLYLVTDDSFRGS